MDSVKYGLIGASGKMGKEISSFFEEANHECVFTYDITGVWFKETPRLLIDFSLPAAFHKSCEYVVKFNSPLIIGTTGLTPDQLEQLQKISLNIPVVQSNNYSTGIQLLLQCIELVKDQVTGWDVEISETHHRFKLDKPSGTALMLQKALGQQVNISSLRLGGVPGEHSIHFGGIGETLTFQHTALSRRTFAEGVLRSADFIMKQAAGLFSFRDVLNSSKH